MVAATWRRGPSTLVAFAVAALLVAARCADAGRIINLITPSAHSHLMNQKKISTELAARGHDVVVRRGANVLHSERQALSDASTQPACRTPVPQVEDNATAGCGRA